MIFFESTSHAARNMQNWPHSQGEPKFLKDYKAKYKKIKTKLALLEASPSTYQSPKPFQSKNKGLVSEMFDWDEKEVSDDEEETQVKVYMALVYDELFVGNNNARNGEWIDITMKKGASPSSEVMTLTYQDHSPRKRPGLGTMKRIKPVTYESSNKSVSGPIIFNENINFTKKIQESKSVNPQPESSKSVNSSKLSQDSKSNGKNIDSSILYYMKCKKEDHRATDHDIHVREPIGYLGSGCSGSMTGVKSYLHKYVEQLGHKVAFGDNSSCIIEGYGSINCGGIFSKVAFVNGLKYNLISISQLCDAKYIVQFDDKMVENQNDVKVKQIRTDNGTEFRNSEIERLPVTLRIDQLIVKRHDKTPYEIFRERIPDINYFHVLCPVFFHNHKDHLGKFDAKADDGYFLGYSFVSKAFRVYNTRRQQIEETYHVTFDESMKATRFTNTSVDEIGIDDSSMYHSDEFLQEDDLSRQYQANSDISYYIIPHGRSLTKLTQETHVLKVITSSEQYTPRTKDVEVARIEAIRIFLAFATYMNFMVFQVDVKSAFLNGKLKEEVYVKQPHGFESSEFHDYVCKLDKAFYGLKQAPRTWYETLSTFFIQNNFVRGRIDNTLFIYRSKGDVLLVQYDKRTHFLGLQIKQDEKRISVCQEQYTMNLLKKYEIYDSSLVKTPMVPPNNPGPDLAVLNMSMCKISGQSKRITSHCCEKNLQYTVCNTLVNEEKQARFTQYAVFIKKIRRIRAYTSPDTMKDLSPIRRIQEHQYAVFKIYYTRSFWKISNVVPTLRKPNTSYPTSMDTAYQTDYQTLYIDDPELSFKHTSESLNYQVNQETIRRA
ncbi:retrovirus-related pol polyprotein from transposon TNT 1-94 [Tanacetum coccineum]